jgi:hypothetical protein
MYYNVIISKFFKTFLSFIKAALFVITIFFILGLIAAVGVLIALLFYGVQQIALYILLALFALLFFYLMGFSYIKLFPKTSKKERKYLVFAGLIACGYLSFFPLPDGPIILGLAAVVNDEGYIFILYYLLVMLMIFVITIPINLLILNILRGSSKIEGKVRKWSLKRKFIKSLIKIDYFLYRTTGMLGSDLRTVTGWRVRLMPFPLTIAWVIIVALIKFLSIISLDDSMQSFITILLVIFSAFFLTFGILIHFVNPPLSRRFKYDVILGAFAIIPLGTLIKVASYIAFYITHISQYVLIALFIILFVVFLINSQSIFKRILPKNKEKLIKWVRVNTIILVPILIFSFGDIGSLIIFTYLLMRYFLIELLFHSPILYFRSFKSDLIQDYFTNVIAKAASKYGVVVGLVHSDMINEEYRSNNRVEERARLFMTSNETWKDWVMKHLRKASVVIIHLDVKTPGVIWEVDISNKIVGSENVIILEPNFQIDNATEHYYEKQREYLDNKLKSIFISTT